MYENSDVGVAQPSSGHTVSVKKESAAGALFERTKTRSKERGQPYDVKGSNLSVDAEHKTEDMSTPPHLLYDVSPHGSWTCDSRSTRGGWMMGPKRFPTVELSVLLRKV